jgi:hypothetical protein
MNLRALAALLLALCAFPTGTYGQIHGWASCENTRTDEKLLTVVVALMDGDFSLGQIALEMDKEKNERKLLEFEAGKVNVSVTGMRLTCIYQMPDPALQNIVQSTTVNWAKPVRLPKGAVPKLFVVIEEPAPGLRRVGIGRK